MKDYDMQRWARTFYALIGYLAGFVAFIGGIYFSITKPDEPLQYVIITLIGLCTTFLADMSLDNQQRMDVLLKIIKNQDKKDKPKEPPFSNRNFSPFGEMGNVSTTFTSFDKDGNIVSSSDEIPEEYKDFLKNFGFRDEDLNSKKEKSFEQMPIDELRRLKDEALDRQDYERAAYLRDIINERQDNNGAGK